DLRAAAQAGGSEGRDRCEVRRVRDPERLRGRVRAGLCRAVPEPSVGGGAGAARVPVGRPPMRPGRTPGGAQGRRASLTGIMDFKRILRGPLIWIIVVVGLVILAVQLFTQSNFREITTQQGMSLLAGDTVEK